MTPLTDVSQIALHQQHSIQSDDVLAIYRLARAEGVSENLETLSFKQFLGLSCYLFVTTQSTYGRQKLSHILPKFGSDVVSPLVRILQHFLPTSELGHLALQSLDSVPATTLAIGLSQLLAIESSGVLKSTARRLLIKLCHRSGDEVYHLLPQILSERDWGLVKKQVHSTLFSIEVATEHFVRRQPGYTNVVKIHDDRLCV